MQTNFFPISGDGNLTLSNYDSQRDRLKIVNAFAGKTQRLDFAEPCQINGSLGEQCASNTYAINKKNGKETREEHCCIRDTSSRRER